MESSKPLRIAGLDLNEGGNFLISLQRACEILKYDFAPVEKTTEIDWNWLRSADAVVAHIKQNSLQEMMERVKPGCIFIRVQMLGFKGTLPTYLNNRPVMHLFHNSGQLAAPDWVSLLPLVIDHRERERFFAGDRSSLLNQWFRRIARDHLLALAVLCQGYLAVHAVRRGDEWGPTGIAAALTKMQWPTFMIRHGQVQQRIQNRLDDATFGLKLKKDVANGAWWRTLLGGVDPFSVCGDEWGPQKDAAWDRLVPLLVMIRDDQTIPEPTDTPHLVAEAFLSICDKSASLRP